MKWTVNSSHHHVLEHVLIRRFIQGYFNSHPPPPKPPRTTWDIQKVLDYWLQQPGNYELELSVLARKTVMLILLSTCRRKNELLSLSVKHMYNFPQCITFFLIDLPKAYCVYSPHEKYRWLSIRQFNDLTNAKLCPVRAITAYLLRTKKLRTTDRLFIRNTPPYTAIKPMTLNSWILRVMKDSGIDTSQYNAYSTRHASSSGAADRGVPIDDIMNLGGWASPSTFIKHYNLPILHNALTGNNTRAPQLRPNVNLQEIITPHRYIPPP